MFKNWTVLKNKKDGTHEYFYGTYTDWIREALDEDFEQVPENEITVEDLNVMFGNELEDKNYHYMTDLGDVYLKSLAELNLSIEDKFKVFKTFIDLVMLKYM